MVKYSLWGLATQWKCEWQKHFWMFWEIHFWLVNEIKEKNTEFAFPNFCFWLFSLKNVFSNIHVFADWCVIFVYIHFTPQSLIIHMCMKLEALQRYECLTECSPQTRSRMDTPHPHVNAQNEGVGLRGGNGIGPSSSIELNACFWIVGVNWQQH